MSSTPPITLGAAACAIGIMVLGACGGDSVAGPGGEDVPDELNFVEQEVAAIWYRYHSYDGSSQYLILQADRAWCEWEEPNGSNRKVSYSEGDGWSVNLQEDSNGNYTVTVPGSGLIWKYDFADDDLWPNTYRRNLTRRKTNSAKSCD